MNSQKSQLIFRSSSRTALTIACGLGLAVLFSGETTLAGDPGGQAKPWKAPRRASRKKNPISVDAASLKAGKAVFLRECLSCHGASGKGNGPKAAGLNPHPTDLSLPAIWEQSDGAIFWKITKGRTPMPSYKKLLSEEDRWHVINYIHSFGGKTIAPTPPKYKVSESYRKAISSLLKPYLKMQDALVDEDLTASRDQYQRLVQATDAYTRLESDALDAKAGKQWGKDQQSITKNLQPLPAELDLDGMRKVYATLSIVFADTVEHFGHAEKKPLRLYVSPTKINGKSALWMQHDATPHDPYTSNRKGTLKKLLSAHL